MAPYGSVVIFLLHYTLIRPYKHHDTISNPKPNTVNLFLAQVSHIFLDYWFSLLSLWNIFSFFWHMRFVSVLDLDPFGPRASDET